MAECWDVILGTLRAIRVRNIAGIGAEGDAGASRRPCLTFSVGKLAFPWNGSALLASLEQRRLRNNLAVIQGGIGSAITFPPKQFPRTPTRPETIL
ncbi:hypothetical protein [Sphingomonas azotifigens]|uniref:hypothetical protein n=1 Tax=Sphingomonas azotifigens TaxID=330920 RepID=UPI0009FC30D4|nr:hypothetical protein [Sphingomonas azotifigens]